MQDSSSAAYSIHQNETVDFEIPSRPAINVEKWKRYDIWNNGFLVCLGIVIATNTASKSCYHAPFGSTSWTALPPTLEGHAIGSVLALEDGRIYILGGVSGGNNLAVLKCILTKITF